MEKENDMNDITKQSSTNEVINNANNNFNSNVKDLINTYKEQVETSNTNSQTRLNTLASILTNPDKDLSIAEIKEIDKLMSDAENDQRKVIESTQNFIIKLTAVVGAVFGVSTAFAAATIGVSSTFSKNGINVTPNPSLPKDS